MANDFNIADGPGAQDGIPRTDRPGTLILGDDGTNLQTVQVTAAGVLKSELSTLTGVIDSGNSTSTPLAGGGNFTGTWTDVLNYAEVSLQIWSNVASASLGIIIQTSQDGISAEAPHSRYSLVSNTPFHHTFKPVTRYWRLLFNNGLSAQATFRVQAILRPTATGCTSTNQTPFADEPGLVVRNIPSGTQAVSVASLPLPTGAATEATLSALNTKIPANPATDRSTAAAPFSVRLSDGTTFYNTNTAAQLPAALVSGRLDVNIGASINLPLADTIVDNGAFVDGTSKVFPLGYVFDEVAGTALTENDAAAARIDSKRAQIITLEDPTTRGARVGTGLIGNQRGLNIIVPNLASYRAVYKPTGNAVGLSNAFGANGSKQFATLYHAGSSTKTVRITRVLFHFFEAGGITSIRIALVRLTSTTAPATGNPAITPTLHDTSDSAAEATALALPTTAGSEGGSFSTAVYQFGNTGTNTDANVISPSMVIYDWNQNSRTKQITLRAGVAEGVAIKLFSSAAQTVQGEAVIEFTEET